MVFKDFYKPDYTLLENVDLHIFSEPLLSVVKEWVARGRLTCQNDVDELYKALVDAKKIVDSSTEYDRLENARSNIIIRLIATINQPIDIFNDPLLMGIHTCA
ncbi:MAG: hypothetical protein WCG98_08800 [bacterium]